MRILFGRDDDANGIEVKHNADGSITIWPLQARMRVATGGPVEIPACADDIELVALQLMKIVEQKRAEAADTLDGDGYVIAPQRLAVRHVPMFPDPATC